MKSTRTVIIVVLVVLIGVVGSKKYLAYRKTKLNESAKVQNIQPEPTPGTTETLTVTPPQKPADAREIIVVGSNYKFAPNKISVKKGEKVRILFKSSDGVHDFKIDELRVATSMVSSGQEDFVEFTPETTGSFEFYCSISSHRAMGMKGNLVVE